MQPADILASLFPRGHAVTLADGRIFGSARLATGETIQVLGLSDGTPLGIEDALWLSGEILDNTAGPVLLMIDTGSQRMSRRDELLGLSEYLAHLAKTLLLAEELGRRTIGLLYGHTAAGAFIATALAAGTLVALPGAEPEVMDLASMARVTKLPLDVLRDKAATTPVFAPGLANLATTGAVLRTWNPDLPLDSQLAALLAELPVGDRRDRLGKDRGGRPKAADIAARVASLAADGG